MNIMQISISRRSGRFRQHWERTGRAGDGIRAFVRRLGFWLRMHSCTLIVSWCDKDIEQNLLKKAMESTGKWSETVKREREREKQIEFSSASSFQPCTIPPVSTLIALICAGSYRAGKRDSSIHSYFTWIECIQYSSLSAVSSFLTKCFLPIILSINFLTLFL